MSLKGENDEKDTSCWWNSKKRSPGIPAFNNIPFQWRFRAMNNGIKADLVLQNGFVYTVDKQRSRAKAVAVRDKDIIYVGDTEGVRKSIGPNTKKADMVVLDRNLFDIPETEIADTNVLMTLFEGKPIFRDKSI